ncbi:MAG: UDP-N-acetylglucosamine 2-epimerase [Chloroflexota bacterium]
MIHIFVGTKAQFIKMAPIMQELDQRGIAYNFIDAGQHAGLTGSIVSQFQLRNPDISLRTDKTNITTKRHAILWTLQNIFNIIWQKKKVYQAIFQSQPGICLIHGDTLTTLLSLLYAKRCGIQVGHVEAGVRSFHLFDPFPEEIIRLIASRFSDYLFSPSPEAYQNLSKMGHAAKTIDTGANTILDTVRYAQKNLNGQAETKQPYAIVTIHRFETIHSRSRLTLILNLLDQISETHRVIFVQHGPTRLQLDRFGFSDRLEQNQNIEIIPLQPYLTFIQLITEAEFVITDGGSIQEECYYLNIPCLIMRAKTEHAQGEGTNIRLANFDQTQINAFLEGYQNLRRTESKDDVFPAKTIVDTVLAGHSQ